MEGSQGVERSAAKDMECAPMFPVPPPPMKCLWQGLAPQCGNKLVSVSLGKKVCMAQPYL
jgi:hypothetical protein